MPRFTHLAIEEPDKLLFGHCPLPITTRSGLTIGDGLVLPEINFPLPPCSSARTASGGCSTNTAG